MKLIFASNSPRRKELLSKFDINIKFDSHSFDEVSIKKNINPYNYCRLIAEGKSFSLVDKYPNTPIISADTIVVSPDNKIFEKPKKNQEAFNMLSALNGKTHKVLTGMNILYLERDVNFTFAEETLVTFNQLDPSEISYYIEKYKPFDKAGSYGIQDFSSIFVNSINGCYFNVVGLPLSSLFYHLKKFKLVQFP